MLTRSIKLVYKPLNGQQTAFAKCFHSRFTGTQKVEIQHKKYVPQPTGTAAITPKNNYYHLLGLKKDASGKDIKTAYYHLAKQYHPDAKHNKDPEAKKKFQEITEAYNILIDDKRRFAYDRFVKNQALPTFNETMFGLDVASNTQKINKSNKKPLEITLAVPFLNSVHGTTRDVHLNIPVPCDACINAPKTNKNSLVTCTFCNGSGYQMHSGGSYKMQMKCKQCNGSRYTQKPYCIECGGQGSILTQKKITVTVPAGVCDKDVLKVKHPTINDEIIHVRIKIEDYSEFKRDEYDVYSSVQIPFTTAILGGLHQIQNVYGNDSQITIPPGTESDTLIKLRGQGISRPKHLGAGDHIIQIKIKIPKAITDEQREALVQYCKLKSVRPVNFEHNLGQKPVSGARNSDFATRIQSAAEMVQRNQSSTHNKVQSSNTAQMANRNAYSHYASKPKRFFENLFK